MNYMKQMQEQKDAKIQEMNNLVNGAKTENRAMTEDEQSKFDALEKEIAGIEKSIEMEKRAVAMSTKKNTKVEETKEEKEERAFVDYVLNAVENRAEGQLAIENNKAIVPTSIANKIIKAVKDKCPILARATVFHVNGTLKVPVYGEDGTDVTVAYSKEFTELTESGGTFTSIDLEGYLMGALTLVGLSLENNAEFSVIDFIVDHMAESIALFLEGELLNGTEGKMTGALSTTNVVTAASATALTSDELIKLQSKVKQAYQANACWVMSPEAFDAVKLLKDGNERHMLQDNIANGFPYTVLGKPVFLSDNMPKMESGKKAILYGDMTGLSVNIRENMKVQVLREKYATMHAVGVIAWMEADSKVTDNQKLAVLQMA